MELIFPTTEHKEATLAYRQEWLDSKPGESIHGSWGLQRSEYENYEKWLGDIEGLVNGKSNNPNIDVPTSTYLALCDSKIVGNIQIRHSLNDYLLSTYGHIGYAVRPSERRKGYATEMLAMALDKCREIGMERVLVSCNKLNIASAKTIAKNGGVLENKFVDDRGDIVQRYWITL